MKDGITGQDISVDSVSIWFWRKFDMDRHIGKHEHNHEHNLHPVQDNDYIRTL